MQVGVIGLGNIGGHVAANLAADGHDVVVHDVDAGAHGVRSTARRAARVGRRRRRGERGHGAVAARRPAVVRAVADEWAGAAAAGAVLVDLSTNSPEVVRELGARLTATGHHLVEAPLTGGAIGAENRMLVVHGRRRRRRRSRGCSRCSNRSAAPSCTSGALGLGNTMKLVNSLIAFTTTWVSLEGLSIAAKSGIPVQEAVEVLRTDGVANFYLDRMVENIDTRNGPTQFALGLAAKDAGLIVETGRAARRADAGGRGGAPGAGRCDRGRPRRPRLGRPGRGRRTAGRRRAPLEHPA